MWLAAHLSKVWLVSKHLQMVQILRAEDEERAAEELKVNKIFEELL